LTTTSIGTRLGLRKITARIGAEVTGVSPSLELDPETVTAIRAALSEHKALVFRGISVDDDGQQRFARYFGPLTSAHPTVPAVDGEPNVLPVDSENSRSNHWHTDVTFVLNPPQASTLRSIVIPPYGGETMIANAGAAYRDLPGPLRAFADTLRAVHTNDYDYAVPPESLNKAKRARRAVFTSTKYETVHPVVRVHPLTGERGAVHRRVRAADRGVVHGGVEGHLAAAAALRDPAGEHPAGVLGAGPAGPVRQPDHPALRHRQLR
jgi:alpha-ketoglutarate-dependent taurine dioxygenase